MTLNLKKVKTVDCVPMKELSRQYYDPSNYKYLRRIIEQEGVKSCYPLRGFWNPELKRYEIFVGIHRLKVANDMGTIPNVWIEDCTPILRADAVAEGVKSNKTQAYYNPMDLAEHLDTLGKSISEAKNSAKSRGRPTKYSLHDLSDRTGLGTKNIWQYLQLLKLPDSVRKLIGEGKIRFTKALVLERLLGTPHEKKIPSLAYECYKKDWSRRQLTKIVEAIKKHGFYEDTKACQKCKRAFPNDKITNLGLCPKCLKETLGEVREVSAKPLPISEKADRIRRILKKHIETCRKTNCEGIDCLTQCLFYAERFKKRKRRGVNTNERRKGFSSKETQRTRVQA